MVGAKHASTVGARAVLKVGDAQLTRFSKAGGSYASSGDRRLLFGLGSVTKTGRLTVVWPDGKEQHFDDLGADCYHRIVQGKDKPEGKPGRD